MGVTLERNLIIAIGLSQKWMAIDWNATLAVVQRIVNEIILKKKIEEINVKTIFIIISFFILTSCYAAGNLGVIQKINDADMIVEGIGNLIEGDGNSKE